MNMDFTDDLKRSGLKSTRQRTAILDILAQSDQPIAAEQVYFELKQKDIPANLSTVYRTLEIFADKNLVSKLNISADSRTLFEYNQMIHRHYLICLGCKKILAINSCPLEDYEQSLATETDYLIVRHKLSIYGYCPECKKSLPKGLI